MPNQYYPIFVGSDGQVHQSGTPVDMPDDVTTYESLYAWERAQERQKADELKKQEAANNARNRMPNLGVGSKPKEKPLTLNDYYASLRKEGR